MDHLSAKGNDQIEKRLTKVWNSASLVERHDSPRSKRFAGLVELDALKIPAPLSAQSDPNVREKRVLLTQSWPSMTGYPRS